MASAPTTADPAARARERPFPLRVGIATVTQVTELTPRMARISLAAPELAGLPDEEPGEILTLVWPPAGAADPILPDAGTWRFPPGTPDQHWRNYTIRRITPDGVDLDFVLHGDHGPASAWAVRARPGDRIGFAGPRIHFFADPAAAWTLLCGDETALPSIAATVERLPAGHRVLAFVEVADRAERQPLERSAADLDLTWVERDGEPAGLSPRLEQAVRAAELPDGPGKVWVAGESLAVRALREHLRDERGLPIGPQQAIGYWKHRTTPDDPEVE